MSSVLERLTQAQNSHDPQRLASYFTGDYQSDQPAHPDRTFSGRVQVLEKWTSVVAGVPDFRAELLASCRNGNVEWGEVDWSGYHADGSPFAMLGVIIATIRDDQIEAGWLYVEPVEHSGAGIDTAIEQLYRPPDEES